MHSCCIVRGLASTTPRPSPTVMAVGLLGVVAVAQPLQVGPLVPSWPTWTEPVEVVDVRCPLATRRHRAPRVCSEVPPPGVLPSSVVPSCAGSWSSSIDDACSGCGIGRTTLAQPKRAAGMRLVSAEERRTSVLHAWRWSTDPRHVSAYPLDAGDMSCTCDMIGSAPLTDLASEDLSWPCQLEACRLGARLHRKIDR